MSQKHLDDLMKVRELVVARRRQAVGSVVAVMDVEPEQIDPWLAKIAKHQEAIDVLNRAIEDEEDEGLSDEERTHQAERLLD